MQVRFSTVIFNAVSPYSAGVGGEVFSKSCEAKPSCTVSATAHPTTPLILSD